MRRFFKHEKRVIRSSTLLIKWCARQGKVGRRATGIWSLDDTARDGLLRSRHLNHGWETVRNLTMKPNSIPSQKRSRSLKLDLRKPDTGVSLSTTNFSYSKGFPRDWATLFARKKRDFTTSRRGIDSPNNQKISRIRTDHCGERLWTIYFLLFFSQNRTQRNTWLTWLSFPSTNPIFLTW